jgi:ABC-2 type transport system ATP-binding protein
VPAAVVVTDLRKQFGSLVALDGVSWEAQPGRVTAVLGPNGAGKTTMVECCEGLRRPDSGTVRVLGTQPWHAGADHRARVGVMLQDGGLPNAARPVALLRHLAQLYAAPRDVDDLASRLGIDRFAGTPVRRLSGGQRQRVALAAALVGAPDVVLTTHSFEEAERIADEIVIVADGRVVAEGSREEITAGRSLENVYFELTRRSPR